MNFWRTLRGKITLTYTAVTGLIFLLVWLGIVVMIYSLSRSTTGTVLGQQLFEIVAADTAEFLSQEPIDPTGLEAYLDLWVSGESLRIENDLGNINAVFGDLRFVAVTDLAGEVLAVEPRRFEVGPLAEQVPAAVMDAWEQAAVAQEGTFGLTAPVADETLYYQLIPIADETNRPLGVMVIVHGREAIDSEIGEVLPPVFALTSVVILCGTIIMGTFFGWIASRGLVRRLRRLEVTVGAWAEGEFSPRVTDRSADEIGQLGRHLNQMAERLQALMATQTAVATAEERNRLARDLHDTAKQQLFAANMQLASAQQLLPEQPEKAQQILTQVEKLTEQVQAELTMLIQSLRPIALQDQGLSAAVAQYAADWSGWSNIQAEVAVQNERPLPIEIEQALYRVLQEALANVAKHAQATHTEIQLAYQPQTVTLRIRDNGIGFNPETAAQGVGLQSMNERLATLRGFVTIDSQEGRGTEVTALVEVYPND